MLRSDVNNRQSMLFFFSYSVGAGEVLHFAGAAAAEKGRLGLAALRAAGEGQPGPHTAGEHTDAQQSCHCLHQPGSQVINRFSCTFAAALLLFSTARFTKIGVVERRAAGELALFLRRVKIRR